MRALPVSLSMLCLLVAIVAARPVRAELPHLALRLADVEPPRLGVTGASVAPVTPLDVAAVNRVEGLAVRALQPRLEVQSQLVRAVKLTPMWPLGAYVTFEYGARR
jgi:hypothetical protein